MGSFVSFFNTFSPDSNQRGKQFEHFVKWFLENDPQWSTQVDEVWLWDEYPDSWGRDCGIDLVFRHKNGENWAVQAKCYSSTTSISKADVDSFISESNRDGIDKRLLIATTDLIGANAKQVCDAQDKSVTRFLLSNFEDADIEYPSSIEDLPKAKRKERPKPRDHQIEAIEAVTTKFGDVDRGQLIMACGTGKTFTTLWIKEKLGAESTLVLLPSLGLLSQTLHEWTLAANEGFQVLCVCSDESVGKKGSDEAVHSIADLAFPVTSSVNEIRAFLNSSGKKVVFSTYQSSPLIAEAQSDKVVPAFSLAIADEAHRCAGKVSGDFSTILDGRKIRATKRLFTTATPRTYSSSLKKAAEDRGVEVVGMDDEAVFGKQLFVLNFGEAIKLELLTDYRVVIIGVDNPTISAWIENRELLKADTGMEMDAQSLAAQIGLLKAIKDYDLRRLISFHSRVSRAEAFSQDIHKVLGWIDEKYKPSGELKSDFVSGDMLTDKRKRKLTQLKGLQDKQRGLLTNARCLSEGVDVPSLDGVAFIDPRSSKIDIIQAVGRAIRLSDKKKAGTIVLPVFIAKSEDPEQALDESTFKPIWDVLNALKAHDDILADELNHIRTELGRKGGGKVDPDAFSKISIDLPVGIDRSFGDNLRTVLVEQTTASWGFWFGLLEKYVDEHGDCLVPTDFVLTNGYKLGAWLANQRGRWEKLTPDKKVALESLSGWTLNIFEEKWDVGYLALQEYAQEHGDCLVKGLFKTKSGFSLGKWVNSQRVNREMLSPERKLALESINGWTWNVNNDKWEKGFLALKNYAKEYGNCLVPSKYKTTNNYKLGAWVSIQRRDWKNISTERKLALESIQGWSWNGIDSLWEQGFLALKQYVEEHGHSLVPAEYITKDDYQLGRWVVNQRKRKDGTSPDRIMKLESLAGWSWDPITENWEKGYEALKEYSILKGNCLVPQQYETSNGFRLGVWVATQRRRKESHSADNKIRLESLQGWSWNRIDTLWEEGYTALKNYTEKHGDSGVTAKYISNEGYKLGIWVTTQRRSKAINRLSSEKVMRLESLKGWVWNNEEIWEKGYEAIREYINEHGNCLVPKLYKTKDGYSLGNWVDTQRRKKDSLPIHRRERLEALKGWVWNVLDAQWESSFMALREYSEANGNCFVIDKPNEKNGINLKTWVEKQRAKWDDLPEDRRKKLASLNGWFLTKGTKSWEEGYKYLSEYAKVNRNSLVPSRFKTEDGFKLGAWVKSQRSRKDFLSQERKSKLESLKGWSWGPRVIDSKEN